MFVQSFVGEPERWKRLDRARLAKEVKTDLKKAQGG
jgi:hypothetical protein